MNKQKIIISCLITIVVIYLIGIFIFSLKVLPNTELSDHKIEMINKASLEKTVKEQFGQQTIAIKDEVITDYNPKLVDLGASIDSTALSSDIDANQPAWLWPINIFKDQNYDLTKYIKVDEGQLNGRLVTDKILSEEGRTKSANAKTTFDKKTSRYVITKEVNGNMLGDEFKTELTKAIQNGDSEFDATKYYVTPTVVEADLSDDVETLNSRLERKVTVKFGERTVEIPAAKVATFIFINDEGKIDVDNDKLYDYLFTLSADYDNAKKSGGERIVTSYNVDNAYYQIEDGLLSDENKDIVGETKVETYHQASNQTSIPSSGTYIEVSISQQYMWLYNDDELVIGTPVVTGNVSEGWDTPTGTFKVWNKETDKVLNGASVGYDYQVPVDYWMAIDYTGVGIHDIDWLTSSNSSTSGDVYLTDGSHGCINTPNDLMATVYNNTPIGTPVYVMP